MWREVRTARRGAPLLELQGFISEAGAPAGAGRALHRAWIDVLRTDTASTSLLVTLKSCQVEVGGFLRKMGWRGELQQGSTLTYELPRESSGTSTEVVAVDAVADDDDDDDDDEHDGEAVQAEDVAVEASHVPLRVLACAVLYHRGSLTRSRMMQEILNCNPDANPQFILGPARASKLGCWNISENADGESVYTLTSEGRAVAQESALILLPDPS